MGAEYTKLDAAGTPVVFQKQHPLSGEDIAQIPLLEGFVDFFPEIVPGDEQLDSAADILQGGETGFSHHAL